MYIYIQRGGGGAYWDQALLLIRKYPTMYCMHSTMAGGWQGAHWDEAVLLIRKYSTLYCMPSGVVVGWEGDTLGPGCTSCLEISYTMYCMHSAIYGRGGKGAHWDQAVLLVRKKPTM